MKQRLHMQNGQFFNAAMIVCKIQSLPQWPTWQSTTSKGPDDLIGPVQYWGRGRGSSMK